jgi:hypothetical protein
VPISARRSREKRLSTATIEAFTAAYGEKHWQRKAAQLLETLAPLLAPPPSKPARKTH